MSLHFDLWCNLSQLFTSNDGKVINLVSGDSNDLVGKLSLSIMNQTIEQYNNCHQASVIRDGRNINIQTGHTSYEEELETSDLEVDVVTTATDSTALRGDQAAAIDSAVCHSVEVLPGGSLCDIVTVADGPRQPSSPSEKSDASKKQISNKNPSALSNKMKKKCHCCGKSFKRAAMLKRHKCLSSGIGQSEAVISTPSSSQDNTRLPDPQENGQSPADHGAETEQKVVVADTNPLEKTTVSKMKAQRFECSHCHRVFRNQSKFKYHSVICTLLRLPANKALSAKNRKCFICEAVVIYPQQMISHIELCKKRNKPPTEPPQESQHVLQTKAEPIMLKKTIYNCSRCSLKMHCKSEWEKHLKDCQAHVPEEAVKTGVPITPKLPTTCYKNPTCYKCGRKFVTQKSRNIHVSKCNPLRGRNLTCPLCCKKFSTNFSLKRHYSDCSISHHEAGPTSPDITSPRVSTEAGRRKTKKAVNGPVQVQNEYIACNGNDPCSSNQEFDRTFVVNNHDRSGDDLEVSNTHSSGTSVESFNSCRCEDESSNSLPMDDFLLSNDISPV